jgi:hypothetical protein
MVEEDVLIDMAYAQRSLKENGSSIVAVKGSKVIKEKTGSGLRPFLELISELGDQLSECVIGDRILGKASALLCRYSMIRGVYSPEGTKTAIATLIIGAIPCQVDSLIPFIKNLNGDGVCRFEQLLKDVDDPHQAYELLYEKLMKTP